VRLAYHFGPAVACRRDGDALALEWEANGRTYRGRLSLPAPLTWREYRGSNDPMLGWYSSAFNEREPSSSFIGSGTVAAGVTLATRLQIALG
jgi:hypothetical protein